MKDTISSYSRLVAAGCALAVMVALTASAQHDDNKNKNQSSGPSGQSGSSRGSSSGSYGSPGSSRSSGSGAPFSPGSRSASQGSSSRDSSPGSHSSSGNNNSRNDSSSNPHSGSSSSSHTDSSTASHSSSSGTSSRNENTSPTKSGSSAGSQSSSAGKSGPSNTGTGAGTHTPATATKPNLPSHVPQPKGEVATKSLGGGKQEHSYKDGSGNAHTVSTGSDGKTVRAHTETSGGKTTTTHYAPDGKTVRQTEVSHPDGSKEVTSKSFAGRTERTTVTAKDGTKTTKEFGAHGQVKREEVVHKDGSRDVVTRQGSVSVHETIIVRNNVTIRNVTINNTRAYMPERFRAASFERHYERDHWGHWIYGPRFVVGAPVFLAWYDPFWYTPAGVVIVHPFHFAWGWESYGWYGWCGPYWRPAPVYPAPYFWATDFMVASYIGEHYAEQPSIDDAREEARVAHEESVKAQAAAAEATADVEEAKRLLAEARAKDEEATARLARVQSMEAGKPSPTCVPMDDAARQQLSAQVDVSIKNRSKGVPTALKDSLADPKHIYVVSKAMPVTTADGNPAGEISEGDLLVVDAGQDLSKPDQTPLIKMKILTSKGEDGEAKAGVVINVSLEQVQEFDNEFQAKTDDALAASEKNQDAFKKGS